VVVSALFVRAVRTALEVVIIILAFGPLRHHGA